MLYARLLLGAVTALLIIYYIMIIVQCFGGWKITNKKIKFNKLILPFYYWMV